VVISLKARIEGGLIGLLVGDALGVPYEFHRPTDLPSLEEIEFNPPRDFRRSHKEVRTGTWSDDGAQALALLASLNHSARHYCLPPDSQRPKQYFRSDRPINNAPIAKAEMQIRKPVAENYNPATSE
jgi:ADP-ribosylglycohydrolase